MSGKKDIKSKIYRQQELETKTLGKVRIVKQETKDYGSPQDHPGKVRVRVLEKNIIEWIDENELIFPEKTPPMSGAAKKAKSDQYYKDLGYKNMTFKISPENHQKAEEIKKKLGFSNWNEAFNHIIEQSDCNEADS